MNETYKIYNSGRYGKSDKLPDTVTCESTLEQALFLAEWMNRYYAGQEGMWLVEEHEDD